MTIPWKATEQVFHVVLFISIQCNSNYFESEILQYSKVYRYTWTLLVQKVKSETLRETKFSNY